MKTCWTKVDVCLAGEWPSTGAQHEQRKRILCFFPEWCVSKAFATWVGGGVWKKTWTFCLITCTNICTKQVLD
jgi:hypothetical protein